MKRQESHRLSRRSALQTTGLLALSGVAAQRASAPSPAAAPPAPGPPAPIKLPRLLAPTEREPQEAPAPLPPEQRVGFAVVGLGRLSLEQILPAFAQCKRSRPVALVSGDR